MHHCVCSRILAPVAMAAMAELPVVLPSVASAQWLVTDSAMTLSNWSLTVFQFGPNGGTGNVTQSASGLPGSAMQVNNSCGSNFSGSWNLLVYSPFTYTPANAGAITNLSFSIDSRFIDRLQALSFIIEQGSHVWRVAYWTNTSSWTTYSITNVTSASITPLSTGAPLLPDLSAAGAPLRFGFASANSSAGGFGYTTSGLYDNFRVEFVPAPGVAAMFGAMGVLASRRRR